MSAHTPGPWIAVVTDTTCGGEPAIWEITDKHGGVIAEDISHNPANAHLISSAPDLLLALRFLLADYVAIEGEKITGSSLPADMARAAIAKAKGIEK